MSRVTSVLSTAAVSVGTTATLLRAASAAGTSTSIQPLGGDIYIGSSAVTTSNGLKIVDGSIANVTDHVGALYGRVASGTVDTRVWSQG